MSGGVVRFSRRARKARGTTHTMIATSSGEVEYYGVAHGPSQALGIARMLLGVGFGMKVCVDVASAAAKSIAGLGKARR
eukprot:9209926-Alexandrium_andersonii.AAC.1